MLRIQSSGQQNSPRPSDHGQSNGIEQSVDQAAQQNAGAIALDAKCEAHPDHVPADYRRQKYRAEQSGEIAADRLGECKLRLAHVERQAPLGDADDVGDEEARQHHTQRLRRILRKAAASLCSGRKASSAPRISRLPAMRNHGLRKIDAIFDVICARSMRCGKSGRRAGRRPR